MGLRRSARQGPRRCGPDRCRCARCAWVAGPAGEGITITLALGMLSCIPFIVVLSGLHKLVGRMSPEGMAASVVGLGSAVFIAAAIAVDGASLAVGLASATAPSFAAVPTWRSRSTVSG